jgi:uncharacterized damage-inducible protein DinB
MRLTFIVSPILQQLINCLQQLTKEQYTAKSNLLNGSTIGGHTRHVIELFQCLLNGYETSSVNYEKRKRDITIEVDIQTACNLLTHIESNINKPNKNLQLQGCFTVINDDEGEVTTNYYREVIYNIEHTIHHMALIRVGVNEVSDIKLPQDFGVAPSTIKHKQLCAQ